MVGLGDAASLVLKSPQKAINSVVNLTEYLHLRRQYSRALKLLVGCIVKNIEDRRDLNNAIDRFAEEIDEHNWRLVVKKSEMAKRNLDRYIKHLPSVAPIIVGAHLEVFSTVEEFFFTQRDVFAKIMENGRKHQVDLGDMAHSLKICQRVIKKSEKKHFGSGFDILREIEGIGQTRINLLKFAT